MATELVYLPHTKITLAGNPREDLGDLTDLRNDIKANGLRYPLLGFPDPKKSGAVLIYDGQRRYKCLVALPSMRKKIPVLVDRSVDPAYAMISANVHRKGLNPIEKAKAIAHLMQEKDLKAKDIAKALSLSPGLVSQLLKHLEQPPEIQKALAEGKITPTAARELARIESKAAKKKLLKTAKEKPIDDLKEMVGDQVDREKREKGTQDKPRRGRPTKAESTKPAVPKDEKYQEFSPRAFRQILNGYEWAYYSLRQDKKKFPDAKIPPGFKKKNLDAQESAFLEGMYKAFGYVLGLWKNIKQEGLDKIELPENPKLPKSTMPASPPPKKASKSKSKSKRKK